MHKDSHAEYKTKWLAKAGEEIHFKSGEKIVIEAGEELTLKVGGSFIKLTGGEITSVGSDVYINEGGSPGKGTEFDTEEAVRRGRLVADAGNIVTDAVGGTLPSKFAAPFHQTGPQCDKPEFFALYNHFKKMADELDTDVDFIMAQAAEESGWGTSRAAKEGYNLFGQTRNDNDPRIYKGSDGKLRGTNVVYSSYAEGIQAWVNKWGPHVKGAKTHDQYIDGLLKAGYNKKIVEYKANMKQRLKDVQRRKKPCGILD